MNAPVLLPYDLRVGVTGHRVLADEEAAGRAVDKLLKYIAATLDRASIAPLAWTVVSPLARGADRISLVGITSMPELCEVAGEAATLRGNKARERWKPLRSPRLLGG